MSSVEAGSPELTPTLPSQRAQTWDPGNIVASNGEVIDLTASNPYGLGSKIDENTALLLAQTDSKMSEHGEPTESKIDNSPANAPTAKKDAANTENKQSHSRSSLIVESAQESENYGGVIINDTESGLFGMSKGVKVDNGNLFKDAAADFQKELREGTKAKTPEELSQKAHEASIKSGIGDEHSYTLVASIEEIDDQLYLVWVNEGAGNIIHEYMASDEYVREELKEDEHDVGVVKIEEEDGFAICSSDLLGKGENRIEESSITEAFKANDAQAMAKQLLSAAKSRGKNAVIAIDAYEKEEDQTDTEKLLRKVANFSLPDLAKMYASAKKSGNEQAGIFLREAYYLKRDSIIKQQDKDNLKTVADFNKEFAAMVDAELKPQQQLKSDNIRLRDRLKGIYIGAHAAIYTGKAAESVKDKKFLTRALGAAGLIAGGVAAIRYGLPAIDQAANEGAETIMSSFEVFDSHDASASSIDISSAKEALESLEDLKLSQGTEDAAGTISRSSEAPEYHIESLDKKGDTISHHALDNLTQSGTSNPTQAQIWEETQRILKLNNLSLDEASSLDVGFKFKI